MMQIHLSCPGCGFSYVVIPQVDGWAKCPKCQHEYRPHITQEHQASILKECVVCQGKHFYKQKDFDRRIGIGLFVLASILALWTYGLSFIVLYVLDFIVHRIVGSIAICYQCETVYRDISNFDQIGQFDHETHDRLVYS